MPVTLVSAASSRAGIFDPDEISVSAADLLITSLGSLTVDGRRAAAVVAVEDNRLAMAWTDFDSVAAGARVRSAGSRQPIRR